jgi:hypothetical protein
MHVFIDPTKAYRQRTKSVVDILSWVDKIINNTSPFRDILQYNVLLRSIYACFYRLDESISTEDKVRGRYTFMGRYNMYWQIWKRFKCFDTIPCYLKVMIWKSRTPFIFRAKITPLTYSIYWPCSNNRGSLLVFRFNILQKFFELNNLISSVLNWFIFLKC